MFMSAIYVNNNSTDITNNNIWYNFITDLQLLQINF